MKFLECDYVLLQRCEKLTLVKFVGDADELSYKQRQKQRKINHPTGLQNPQDTDKKFCQ